MGVYGGQPKRNHIVARTNAIIPAIILEGGDAMAQVAQGCIIGGHGISICS